MVGFGVYHQVLSLQHYGVSENSTLAVDQTFTLDFNI